MPCKCNRWLRNSGLPIDFWREVLVQVLREWREGAGLSQEAVAEELRRQGRRISRAMIARWEVGDGLPFPGDVRMIGEFCGAPIAAVGALANEVAKRRLSPPTRAGGWDGPGSEAPVERA